MKALEFIWHVEIFLKRKSAHTFDSFYLSYRALKFAIQFTPQYGDSFIECLHRKILAKGQSCDTSHIEQVLPLF